MDRRWVRRACFALAAAAIAFHLVLVASAVVVQGPCGADDSWFAHIGKNLATGAGYVTNIQGTALEYRARPFDPNIGTGPTVILPAAALIALFGNRPWVPGATVILLWSLPLFACGFLVRRRLASVPSTVAVATAVGLVYATFAQHFEQWYALLGELPAACLLVLALALWATGPRSRSSAAAVGLLLGLACLSKLLAALWVGAFVLVAVAFEWREASGTARERLKALRAGALAFVLPFLCFEAAKLLSLGWSGYRANSDATFSTIGRLGITRGPGTGLLQRAAERLHVFSEQFGVSLIALLFLGAVATWLVLRRERRASGLLAAALFAGFALHVGWWLFVSIGWARYIVIALVPAIVLLALPIATARTGRALLAWAGLLLIVSVPAWRTIGLPLQLSRGSWFTPCAANLNTRAVTRFLEQQARGRTVFTPWWAMVSTLEYESREKIAFQPIPSEGAWKPRPGDFVVLDARYTGRPDAAALTARCGKPALELAPFTVFRCP